MADLLSVYKPEFWANETLLQLFPRLTMANLVHRDFEAVVQEQGDTVNTRIPDKFSARSANPDSFASTKPTATNVKITMDQWKEVTFEIGDKEASLTMKRIYDEFLPNAAQAIAEDVETALMAQYKKAYHRQGAPGTALNDIAKIGTNVKEKFDTLRIPRTGRNVVLGPSAENYFNQIFWKANESGSTTQQVTGELQTKFGQRYFGADLLPSHTAGTATGDANMTCTGVAAASTITIAAGTEGQTFKTGDLLEIGAAKDPYVVTADAAVLADGSASVSISPAVPAGGITAGTAVTVVATHSNSLAFHEQAFCLCSRPLRVPTAPGASVAVQNFNGIGLRAATWYEAKDMRQYVRLDLLYGVALLDGRKAFRLIS